MRFRLKFNKIRLFNYASLRIDFDAFHFQCDGYKRFMNDVILFPSSRTRARSRAFRCHAHCVTQTKLSPSSFGQAHNPTRSEEGLAIARFSAPRILFWDKKAQGLLRNGLSNGELIFYVGFEL